PCQALRLLQRDQQEERWRRVLYHNLAGRSGRGARHGTGVPRRTSRAPSNSAVDAHQPRRRQFAAPAPHASPETLRPTLAKGKITTRPHPGWNGKSRNGVTAAIGEEVPKCRRYPRPPPPYGGRRRRKRVLRPRR